MATNLGSFTYDISFRVDKRAYDNAMKALRDFNITDFQKIQPTMDSSKLRAEYDKIQRSITALQNGMKEAFDPKINTVNIDNFNASLKRNETDLKQVVSDISKFGTVGDRALAQVVQRFTTLDIQVKQTHSFLEKMGTTLANTLRWQAATKAIQTMTGSIQSAYYFTKDLNQSLNNIRIVTDKSAESMDKFAAKAVVAAKALGKSTTDYTNASLIYYQQGLTDEEVEQRTQTTLKAANVTGQSASAVSEELTAVWNGFQIEIDKTEETIDKLAAVAAHSASNLEEISTAMSKVASAANMTGVSVDQLAAQISTIISVTRQAPETVGTALKTIYARMSDLKLGETDEDGVALGDVSGTLESLGINILDTTGELRDMGVVIEEVAEKWKVLSTAQQTALAESLAGKRQYTNLVALFDNWDKYTKNLEISQKSLGTLQRQQDTYMESTKAHLQELATAKEQLYLAIMDDDTINKGADALKSMVESVTRIVTALNGGRGVFALVATILTSAISKPLSAGIATSINNIVSQKQNQEVFEAMKKASTEFGNALDSQTGGKAQIASKFLGLQNKTINLAQKGAISQEEYKSLTEGAKEYAEALARVAVANEKAAAVGKVYNEIVKGTDKATYENASLYEQKKTVQEAVVYEQETVQTNAQIELERTRNELQQAYIKETQTIVDANQANVDSLDAQNKELQEELDILNKLEQETKDKYQGKATRLDYIGMLSVKDQLTINKTLEKFGIKFNKNGAFAKTDAAKNSATIESVRNQISSEINKNQQEISKINEQIATDKNIINQYTKELEKMGGAQGSTTQSSEALQEKIDLLNNKIATSKQKVDSLTQVQKDLEVANRAAATQISAEADAIEKQIAAAQRAANIKNTVQSVTQLITTTAMLTTQVVQLSQALSSDDLNAGDKMLSALMYLPMIISGVVTLTTKITELSFVTASFSTVLVGALGIFAALGIVVAKVTSAKQKEEKDRQKTIDNYNKEAAAAQKVIDAKKQENEQLQQLTTSYKQLSDAEKEGTESLETLQAKTYEMLKAYGYESEALQALTADREKLNKLIRDTTKARLEEEQRAINNNLTNSTKTFNAIGEQSQYQKTYLYGTETDRNGYTYITADTNNQSPSTNTATFLAAQKIQQLGVDILEAYEPGGDYNTAYNLQLANASIQQISDHYEEILNILSDVNKEDRGYDYNRILNYFTEIESSVQQYRENKQLKQDIDLQLAEFNATDGWYDYTSKQAQDIYDELVKNFNQIPDIDVQAKVAEAFQKAGYFEDYQKIFLKSTQRYANILNEYGEDITKSQLDALYNAATQFGDISEDLIKQYLNSTQTGIDFNLSNLVKQYTDNETFGTEQLDSITDSSVFEKWLTNNTNLTIEQFKQQGQVMRDSYIADYLHYLNLNPDEIEKIEEQAKTELKDIGEQISTFYETHMPNEIESINKETKFGIKDSKAVEAIAKNNLQSNPELKALTTSQSNYQKIIDNLKNFKYKTEDALKIEQSLFTKLNNNIDKIQNSYKSLTDAIETYNETGYMTLDQVQSLIDLDPAMLNALYNENGQIDLQKNTLEQLLKVQVQRLRLTIIQEGETRAQAIIEGTMTDADIEMWKAQELLNEALAGTAESTEVAIQKIEAYAEKMKKTTGITEEMKKMLDENAEYTINRLRTTDLINMDDLLGDINDAEEEHLKDVEAELDIYHDINIELEKINKATERLKKTRDKLIGQDLLNSYADEITLLNTENNALERKLALQQKDAADKRAELGAHGVAFDANGQVANYNTILQRWVDQVNATTDKDQREVMEEQRQKLVETLKDYEDLWNNEIEEVKDKLTDNSAAIIQAQVDRMNIVVDTTIDLKDLKRKFNEFKRDYIDKLLPTEFAKAVDTINKNMSATYQAMGMNYEYVTKALAEVQKMQQGMVSDLYGDNINLALEDLQSNSEKLQELMKEVTEDLVAATDKYRESIDELSSAFDRQTEYLEKLAGVYDKQTKAYQLLYGENGAAAMAAQNLEKISDIYNAQGDKYMQQANYWQTKISEWEATVNDPSTTAEVAQALNEQIKDAQDKMIDANEKAGEAYVNAVEKANEGFAQRIAAENNKLAEGILGQSLDQFKTDWEATKELSDMYYDNVNRAYQTSLLMGKYQKSINENTGAAQQKLQNAYDKELATLKEKDKLTKYDLERAEKRYQLVLAQIALEEAQQNKSTLKLARDSQGNYTYQYMSDPTAINDAQEKVNSLANDIYNLDKDNWRANTEAIIADLEKLSQKAAEAFRIFGTDSDEANEVVAKYYEKLNELAKQRVTIAVNAEDSMVSELKRIADSDNVAQLIGNKEYELNKEDYVKLTNANLLTMEEGLINTLSNKQNLFNEQVELKNNHLTQVIADNLDKNFIKWSDTNERIDTNTQQLMANIDGQLVNLQDATDKVLTAIEKRNLQVLGTIQENSGLAVDSYEALVDEITNELIPAHDAYTDELEQEVRFTEQAMDACDKLASKFQNLYTSSGKVIEQVTGIYDALKKFDEIPETIRRTIITEYKVEDKTGNGKGLDAIASTEGTGNEDKDKIGWVKEEDVVYTVHGVHRSSTGISDVAPQILVRKGETLTYTLANPSGGYPVYVKGAGGSGYITISDFIDLAHYQTGQSMANQIPIKYQSNLNGMPSNISRVTYYDGTTKYMTTKDALALFENKKKHLAEFDTGGYTGSWANGDTNGRMAMLHQKEIVLNATDTANLLDMVKYQREMLMIERDAALNKVSAVNESLKSNGGIINPVYNITASFPNAVDHNEIELAILDLPNFAAQRANSNLM